MDESVCGREATMLTGRRWLRKDRRESRREDAIEASRFSRIARDNQKTTGADIDSPVTTSTVYHAMCQP